MMLHDILKFDGPIDPAELNQRLTRADINNLTAGKYPPLVSSWTDEYHTIHEVRTPIFSTAAPALADALQYHNQLVKLRQSAHPPTTNRNTSQL